MSLSEIEQPAPADIRADLAALHEEIHETLRLVRKHDELLERFRPLLARFDAANGSVAARWVRRGAGEARQHETTRLCWCGRYHHDAING